MDDIKKIKRAIRTKCLDCSGGTIAEVALCDVNDCPLHPYRMEMRNSLIPDLNDDELDEKDSKNNSDNVKQLSLF